MSIELSLKMRKACHYKTTPKASDMRYTRVSEACKALADYQTLLRPLAVPKSIGFSSFMLRYAHRYS